MKTRFKLLIFLALGALVWGAADTEVEAPNGGWTPRNGDDELALLRKVAYGVQNVARYVQVSPDASATTDMRAAVQAALDAVETAGGGVVELRPGTYRVTTVNSASSGSKAGGAIGLAIPSGVTLRGRGAIIEGHAGGSFGTGAVIWPKGADSTGSDYGAAANVRLEGFTVRASGQDASSGNLLNLVHCENWTIEDVTVGTSLYHGLECSKARNITFLRCRWDGTHTGGSGSYVQFDGGGGDSGPQSLTPTTTTVDRVTFEGCEFLNMEATGGQRAIEMTHSNTMTASNVTFRNCYFEGQNAANTNILDVNNTGATVRNLLVEGCHFETRVPLGYAFMITSDGAVCDGITFRRNRFTGPGLCMFNVFGSFTGETYNANHGNRRRIVFEENEIRWDKTQLPSSVDHRLVAVGQCQEATIRGNYIYHAGTKPGGSTGTGGGLAAMVRAINCLNLEVSGNTFVMDAADVSTAMGMRLAQGAADTAGTTQRVAVMDNVFQTASAGWLYGIIYNGAAGYSPKAWSFTGNVITGASSLDYSGTVAGWQPASGGALSQQTRTVAASTTLTAADSVLFCNTSSGSITVTFPAAASRQTFLIVKSHASNTVTVGSVTLSAVNSVAIAFSDGTNRLVYQIQ